MDEGLFAGPDAPVAFAHVRAAGATAVLLVLVWPTVAPSGKIRPAGFDPSNPGDPAYRWTGVDREVKLTVAQGLEPIIDIAGAPTWAQERVPPGSEPGPGAYKPEPFELGQFATAAARRYSGSFEGLPRVRYWEVWNEPNVNVYLRPQVDGGTLLSPALYRALVNSFADAVHGVDPTNVVIAGALSPFTVRNPTTVSVAPLRFMRELLCMSKGSPSRPTCNTSVKFDVWSHHPYTSGGPTHKAYRSGDVSLGDLPAMHRLLVAAARSGHVVSHGPVGFWVTEFSWDSKPPDKRGVPAALEGRWVAEALHRMWLSGVSLVTWYQLDDDPWYVSYVQSGLYFTGQTLSRDRPKPAFTAFRFPFVAYGGREGVRVWGRTPWGRRGVVEIDEQAAPGRPWRRAGVIKTDAYGIFSRRLAGTRAAVMRARLAAGGLRSMAFSLRPQREDMKVTPFGS